jgi:hypothetical protein
MFIITKCCFLYTEFTLSNNNNRERSSFSRVRFFNSLLMTHLYSLKFDSLWWLSVDSWPGSTEIGHINRVFIIFVTLRPWMRESHDQKLNFSLPVLGRPLCVSVGSSCSEWSLLSSFGSRCYPPWWSSNGDLWWYCLTQSSVGCPDGLMVFWSWTCWPNPGSCHLFVSMLLWYFEGLGQSFQHCHSLLHFETVSLLSCAP